jgi:MFS superfamily sulfate permease-like transporter
LGHETLETNKVLKDVYVYHLSSPLTFAGLSSFVSALLGSQPLEVRSVILKFDENVLVSEDDLAAVELTADRLSARGIPVLVVLPGGSEPERQRSSKGKVES